MSGSRAALAAIAVSTLPISTLRVSAVVVTTLVGAAVGLFAGCRTNALTCPVIRFVYACAW